MVVVSFIEGDWWWRLANERESTVLPTGIDPPEHGLNGVAVEKATAGVCLDSTRGKPYPLSNLGVRKTTKAFFSPGGSTGFGYRFDWSHGIIVENWVFVHFSY